MTTIIPVASGKGGVGKTIFVANLGVSLAQKGKTVILIDLDLGGSNLHTCLGVKNKHPGIGNFIQKQASTIESLIIPTDVHKLYFVPGDSLIPGTANLQYFLKKKIIKEIPSLVADFIIIDLGGGTNYNTLDFYLTSYSGILMTVPETTSVLNTYSFIKSSIYRLLYRSFPPKSEERTLVHNYLTQRIEGSEKAIHELLHALSSVSASAGLQAREQLSGFYPRIVLNMGKTNKDIALGSKLREIALKNLGVNMEYIGFLPYDDLVSSSILQRTPINLLYPEGRFSRSVDAIAKTLIHAPQPKKIHLYESDEDLVELIEEQPSTAHGE